MPRTLNEDYGSSAGSSTHLGKLTDAKIRVQKHEDSRCGLGCFQQGIGYKIMCLADSLKMAPQCFVLHTIHILCHVSRSSRVMYGLTAITLTCVFASHDLLEYNRPIT